MDLKEITKIFKPKVGVDAPAYPTAAGFLQHPEDKDGNPGKIDSVMLGGLTKLEWMTGKVAAGLLANAGAEGDMGPMAWEIIQMAEYLLDPERSKKEWEDAQIKKAEDNSDPSWSK